MKLIWIHAGLSEVAIKWLDSKADRDSKATGMSISRSDLIRQAVGEMRQKEMEGNGKP